GRAEPVAAWPARRPGPGPQGHVDPPRPRNAQRLTGGTMLGYYFNLALRSFRRNKVLTALMVLAIALGIGATMTTLTVFTVLSGDPLPGKSHILFYPQIEPRGNNTTDREPPDQLTRYDAEALLRDARGDRQAMMTGGNVAIEPASAGVAAFFADARYTSADFFPMFDAPFRYGGGW